MRKPIYYMLLILSCMTVPGCQHIKETSKEVQNSTLSAVGAEQTEQKKTEEETSVQSPEAGKKTNCCDLAENLDDYYRLQKMIFEEEGVLVKKGVIKVNMGKVENERGVKFVEISRYDEDVRETYEYDDSQMKFYRIGKIHLLSTREQCDKEFGKPYKKNKRECVYSSDGYQIRVTFTGEKMNSMGIYKNSIERALEKYVRDGFTMQGCKIVKYLSAYEKEELVKFPEDTVGVCRGAFAVDKSFSSETHVNGGIGRKNSTKKKMVLHIPKNVYLEQGAFQYLGPAEITFEEGRQEIEKDAFCLAGLMEYPVKIKLPQSIKSLGTGAFQQEMRGRLELELNEGLEEIGAFALKSTKCSIPSTVKRIGRCALQFWKPVQGYILPENLEEIGDNCMLIGGEDDPETPIRIPATVRKIGINPITYEKISEKTCGVIVDKANSNFMSTENGWLLSKNGNTLYLAFGKRKKVQIPDNVTKIMGIIQLADSEKNWQKIIFPNKKAEKQYKAFVKRQTE